MSAKKSHMKLDSWISWIRQPQLVLCCATGKLPAELETLLHFERIDLVDFLLKSFPMIAISTSQIRDCSGSAQDNF